MRKTYHSIQNPSIFNSAATRARTASVVLLMCLAALLPTAMQAQFNTFTNDGAITIWDYNGEGGDVAIPESINGWPVTTIANNAFYGRTSLTNITVPSSVTSIGMSAFDSCTWLTNATIGSGVTSIGYHAFFNCTSLATIAVDEGNLAFRSVDGVVFDKGMTQVLLCPPLKGGAYTIPSSVVNIGYGAFDHCVALSSVTIPNSVTNIEAGAFYACSGLASVSIGTSVANIGNLAFCSCTRLTNVTIPDSVTCIYGAFVDCSGLIEITLGTGLTNINGAFVRCSSLRSAVIPGSVTSLDSSFGGCTSLTNVSIPNSVTNIGTGAFSACRNLTRISIPNSVTSIGQYAFEFCTSLTDITIPSSVTTLGTYAFRDCSALPSMIIPDSASTLGQFAFMNCSAMSSISIGKNVSAVEFWTFAGCSQLAAIAVDALNPNMSSADGVLFDKAGTTLLKYPPGKAGSYTVPNTVTNIVMSAFENSGLTRVLIPASVTIISGQAFAGCANLSSACLLGHAPSSDSSVFNGDYKTFVYYLPGTTNWGETFGGRTAMLWNPEIQTADASFGVQTNQFGFTVTGSPNLVLVVEACTNLANPNWYPLTTNTLTSGATFFSDPQWTNDSRRFYRLRAP